MNSMVSQLKAKLLSQLSLYTPAHWEAHWRQLPRSKPDLVALSKLETPLAAALQRLEPRLLAETSEQPNPFGALLAAINVDQWANYCRERHAPCLSRVWLAAASHSLASLKLIRQAHGWGETWEKLRSANDKSDAADDYFFARLHHAHEAQRKVLLETPGLATRLGQARHENDHAFLRRFYRAKQGKGARKGAGKVEQYLVEYWLELQLGLPGLAFFSDGALDGLIRTIGLHRGSRGTTTKLGDRATTKQIRARRGLIQAGAGCHFIDEIEDHGRELWFLGSTLRKPWILSGTGARISWEGTQLWPRAKEAPKRKVSDDPIDPRLLRHREEF